MAESCFNWCLEETFFLERLGTRSNNLHLFFPAYRTVGGFYLRSMPVKAAVSKYSASLDTFLNLIFSGLGASWTKNVCKEYTGDFVMSW